MASINLASYKAQGCPPAQAAKAVVGCWLRVSLPWLGLKSGCWLLDTCTPQLAYACFASPLLSGLELLCSQAGWSCRSVLSCVSTAAAHFRAIPA